MINQIKDFCECVKGATDKDVAELINVVSMATGWMRSPCETLLMDQRREVIDLPPCDKCAFVFEPYYHPFEPDTFVFTLVKVEGLEETKETVTGHYHDTDGKFYLDLDNCVCKPLCGCPPEFKLIVEYSAGYELLPECVLPAMCDLLEVIRAKNECCCEVACGCDGEENVRYATGDIVSVQVQTDLGKMVAQMITSSLGMLYIHRDEEIWGVVV